MLILLDQPIEQVRVAPAKTASNCAGLGLHAIHEEISSGVHATGYTDEGRRKMQELAPQLPNTFNYLIFQRDRKYNEPRGDSPVGPGAPDFGVLGGAALGCP